MARASGTKTARAASTRRGIAVVGVGTMGEAILRGIHASKLVPARQLRGTVRTQARADELRKRMGVGIGIDNEAALRGAGLVIMCLKPQNVTRSLREFRSEGWIDRQTLIVSVAAGVATPTLESVLEPGTPVIRAMPNTPCAIDRGTTVLCGGRHARPSHLRRVTQIFGALGTVLELEEKHFNIVTGLSGSGPAFAYLMIESLADGGVMMGLPRDVATMLAARTLLGASEMVLATGRHPAALKDDVTTPAGCTIAGILALEDGRIRSTLARGVERASRMAAELGDPGPQT